MGGTGVSHADTPTKKVMKKTVTTKSVTTRSVKNLMGKGGSPETQLATVLSGLVTKGTITQAQADAVAAAIKQAHADAEANRPEHGNKGMDGHRGMPPTIPAPNGNAA